VTPRIRGLYAITPDIADTAELLAKVEAALAGGARCLQYRNKAAGPSLRFAQARALLALCRDYQIPLIINDDLALATGLNADGLHLGAEDGSLAAARSRLGPDKVLGASCYNRIENAVAAARDGADYIALGSFFTSGVKPGAVRAPIGLLQEAKRRVALPQVAIGGITLDNAPQLVAAGADSVAVITALFGAVDIRAAASAFSALFSQSC
jgi:thiamine-phosphate pyrophosphorylase